MDFWKIVRMLWLPPSTRRILHLELGKAADLNGNHYIVVSTPGEDTFDGGNQFTIAFWTKEFPDGGWEPFISKREKVDKVGKSRYSGEKKVTFTLRGPVVMILSDLPLMFPTGRTRCGLGRWIS